MDDAIRSLVAEVPGDLVVTAAGRLSTLLAGGLAAILVAERRHLRELTRRALFLRWKTWLVTAPLYVAAVLWSRWGALTFVAALSIQGLREYATLVRLPAPHRVALIGAGIASLVVATLAPELWGAVLPLSILGMALVPIAAQDVDEGPRRLAFDTLGFTWIPWLLGYFLLIRNSVPGGRGILLAVGVAVALSDVLAFVVGTLAGRHALAPRVSPAKTWEGVAGNVVGAFVGFALMSFALPAGFSQAARWVLPALVVGGSVSGDLLESLIKRRDRKVVR